MVILACFEQEDASALRYASPSRATGRTSVLPVLLLGLRAAHVSASSSDGTSMIR
jgi:hypothetical protein